ncbi:signal recognition particle-docking protein FtsY [Vogesella sp. LIG4]|uniref:signal recognition particle-docking protein FtsY n=1 Tax=Vogesella sp. LIG4 TaxID=1192162 RepID=UPI00081FEE09|nr:signal recognition particle-docking protein FtsY [Vogesella sp. LIG4]SCK10383.1 fused signal recognition particle receptor [Vogesella sp. LIG4]
MFSFFKKKPDTTASSAPADDAQVSTPAAAVPAAAPAEAPVTSKPSWTERLKAGLSKTRDKLGKQLAGLFGGGKIDEDLYEELETVLLTADMGVDATVHLLKDVRERVTLKGLSDASELKGALKDSLEQLIAPLQQPLDVSTKKPFVIMMVGVNGAGKTTSIGKLAKYFQSQGKSVLLAAGDTFRAAAREQLMAWGERNNVTVIAQQSGDAAAVCYDAIQAATARGIDIVLADTAGRLPTQLHLMEEIKKVKRVIQKAIPDGPHEVMLVLDANIGQNAINQVKAFDDALGLTGLVLTKLDGTAKGGVIAAIAKQRPVPLRFIGVGESIDDLRPFNSRDYIDALFE